MIKIIKSMKVNHIICKKGNSKELPFYVSLKNEFYHYITTFFGIIFRKNAVFVSPCTVRGRGLASKISSKKSLTELQRSKIKDL